MNASIFSRLFWKEFRTQRGLWIAIVGLFSLFTMLIPVIFGEGLRPDVYSLMYAGLLASGIYAVASTSILYASEVEQGTKSWLGVLPMKPASLMLSKLAWVISSTLTALVAFWCVAHLVGRTELPNRDAEGIWQGMLVIFCLMFCCAIICSQLCSHVLKAIGLAAVFIIGTVFLAGYIHHQVKAPGQFNVSLWYGILSTFCVLYLGFAIVLNRRWLRESSFVWRWSISLGRQLTLDRALALPLETSPLERTWRRQLWLEWRNARGWMLGIALTSVLLMAWISPRVEVRGQMVGFYFSIVACLVPLLCGVASCRGEQLGQRYLFQGNRGVSSGQILWAKHLVWMSFGTILVFGMAGWCLTQINHMDASTLNRGIRPGGFSGDPGDTLLPVIQLVAVIALLTYTIGHICSLLFSQQILGLCVAVLGTSIGVSIVLWGYSFGVPLYVMAFVPAISLFLLSLYRGKNWIIARSDRKVWTRFLGWSLLCLWTVVSLFAGWRVAEVRWTGLAENNDVFQLRYLYPTLCAGLVLCCVLGVALFDFVRRNSKKQLSYSRWFTPLCVLCIFLIGHNSLIALGLTASAIQNRSGSSELREVARAMTYRTLDNATGPDLYLNARDHMTSNLPQEESGTTLSVPQFMPQRSLERSNQARTELLWNTWNDISEAQREWLTANEQALELFDEADRAGVFDRTAIANDTPEGYLLFQGEKFLETDARLLSLVRLKALEREHAGELSEAWEYHLKLIRFVKRALNDALPLERTNIQSWLKTVVIENDLARWQSQNEQTPELLAQAARDLSRERENWPSLGRSYALAGGLMWELIRNPSENWRATTLGLHLPGWERERAMAVVEQITRTNVVLAQAIEQTPIWKSREVADPLTQISIAPPEIVRPQSQQLTLFLEGSDIGYPVPLLVLKTQHLGLTPYRGPWDLISTTFILDHPPRIDFFLSIHDRPERLLTEEINFRIAVQNWLTNCETETPLSAPKPTQETP